MRRSYCDTEELSREDSGRHHVPQPTAVNYPAAYLEIKIEYQPLAAGRPELKSVYPAGFDVKQRGKSSYDLTPGENVANGQFTIHTVVC